MKEKFLVGELAKLFNISTDTLRHYDKLGLLKPEHDVANHYRYYNIRSIFKLSRILFLKNLGIPLNEISDFMKDKNTEGLLKMMRKKNDEIDQRIHQLLNLKHKIELKMDLLQNVSSKIDQIVVKTLPERYGVFLDMNALKDEYEIKLAFKENERYLKISSWLVEGQVYTSLSKADMNNGIYNLFRYFIEIESIEGIQNMKLEVVPCCEYACMTVLGPYNEMVQHYHTLVNWIHQNDYHIVGDSIEKNIVDYDSSESEQDYISEIQIPIAKSH